VEIVLFGLRILLVIALYAFLGVVLWVLLREARQSTAPTVAAFAAARLVQVLDSGIAGREYTVQSAAWIGRDPNCLVRVEDEFASARHAQVLWRAEDQAWWVEDNLSRNGTFVNDERVTSITLKDGDVIRVGRARFKFTNSD
jgi:pSer/pThr/pTyr-binding forkhead associated (FHA) protein